MSRRRRKILWGGAAAIALLSLGAFFWVQQFHQYTPAEALQDLQAAARAKNAPRPVERFLELRYGPLSEPANRQKAFLDFFNVGHIKGMQIIASGLGENERHASIAAMAQWVAGYRAGMTAEEKQTLGAYARSNTGRAALQKATAQYLEQDVRIRAATAPVIQELMTTLAAVQKP